MTYTPQPGTIAHRVIEHLQTLGPDVELTSQVLLEAIGQPADWHGLSTCMDSAVFHGLVVKRLEGRRSMWRIAGKQSAPGFDIDRAHIRLEDHTAIDDSEPNSRPRVATAAEVAARVARQAPARHVDAVQQLAQATDEAATGCEFALTNSGRLLIDTGDQQMALTKEQAEELMQYLDAQRGIEWEGA